MKNCETVLRTVACGLVGAVVTIAIATIACGNVARAEEPHEVRKQADAFTREGTNHFRLNEFDEALKAYKEAYRLAPKPELLYDIGQCYRKLDQKQAAVDSFKNFLQESEDENQRASVRELVQKLETAIGQESAAKNARPQGLITPPQRVPLKSLLGTLRVTSVPDGATVRFDDDDKSRTGTTPATFGDLAPGTRRVLIAKDGYSTVERNVDIGAGGTAVLDVQLSSLPSGEAATPARAPRSVDGPVYKKWWLWTAASAVVVIGAGIGLAVGLSPGPAAPSANTSAGTFRF